MISRLERVRLNPNRRTRTEEKKKKANRFRDLRALVVRLLQSGVRSSNMRNIFAIQVRRGVGSRAVDVVRVHVT